MLGTREENLPKTVERVFYGVKDYFRGLPVHFGGSPRIQPHPRLRLRPLHERERSSAANHDSVWPVTVSEANAVTSLKCLLDSCGGLHVASFDFALTFAPARKVVVSFAVDAHCR